MGDRATIQLVNKDEFSPTIYLHWAGRRSLEILKTAAPKMRKGDMNYAFARLAGHCHNATGGDDEGLSLGIWNETEVVQEDVVGDNGHFKVDLATGEVTNYPSGEVVKTIEFGSF